MFINSVVYSGSTIINNARWFFVRCNGNTVYCHCLRDTLAAARALREAACRQAQAKKEG